LGSFENHIRKELTSKAKKVYKLWVQTGGEFGDLPANEVQAEDPVVEPAQESAMDWMAEEDEDM